MNRSILCLLLLAIASALSSGFVLGQRFPVRRVTDIPTRQETLDSMADEVGLDSDQRVNIREVSDRHQDQMTSVRRLVNDDIARIRSSVRAETRAIMTAAQQARFDAYCKRRDEMRARADQ
jgi:hypothetical protein